jgi:hypothetical protein
MTLSLHEFMENERTRLNAERKSIVEQQRELEKKLADIDRERAAIAAYEITRSGKFAPVQKPATRRTPRKRLASASTPRGSKSSAIFSLIRENPSGLNRAEIIEKMGLKGNKRGEKSVSNALTVLTQSKQVTRQDGKYLTGTA